MIEYLALLLAAIPLVLSEENDQLVFVQALWRHGDRAPVRYPYPNDKYDESYWHYGWKELTNIGIKQMYDVGRYFKKRYGDFVGEFRKDKVKIISSVSTRAITSAQSMLYGFFPAEGKNVWMKGATWRPIPFEISKNKQLRGSTLGCPYYDEISNSDANKLSDLMYLKYEDVFKFLEEKSGFPNLRLIKAKSLASIQNEIYNGLPQEEWVYKTWPNHNNLTTLQLIHHFANHVRWCQYDSVLKAKLRAGLFLNDWLNRVENISRNHEMKPKKMLLYSGHNGIFGALLSTLGVHNNQSIPYASTLIMEVYNTTAGVKVKVTHLRTFNKSGSPRLDCRGLCYYIMFSIKSYAIRKAL